MYADYCWVKLILHYLFTDLTDLLSIDGHTYRYFTEVFTAYTALYSYLQDFYNNLVDLEPTEENDTSSDIDLKDELRLLTDFEVFS